MLTRLFIVLVATTLAACVPKSQLDSAQAEIKRLNEVNEAQRSKIAELEQRLGRKPQMPVKVSLRKAILGSGNVAVFTTTIKEDFPILVTVRSKALGTSQQFRVNLRAAGPNELGHMEGASIDLADELVLENQNYETSVVHFSPR